MKASKIRNPKSEIRNGGHGSNRAVFLDRDGVLIACVVRNGKPYPPMRMEEVEILPGVAEAVRRLAAAGYMLVGASNQPDVGRGTIPREFVEAVNRRLLEQLPEIREIDACYDFDDVNPRRKPNPGEFHGGRPSERHRSGTQGRLPNSLYRSRLP